MSILDRSVVKISGPDTISFLQSIITNDANKLDDKKAIYSLILNPKGRILYDFFLLMHDSGDDNECVLLDCNSSFTSDLVEMLNFYKFHAKVEIEDVSEHYSVAIVANNGAENAIAVFSDPRNQNLANHAILPKNQKLDLPQISPKDYNLARIKKLIPDCALDVASGKSFPLEFGLQNAISFSKGCYIGQEVVSRAFNSGVVRKKLYLVCAEETLPGFGTEIIADDNKIGTMCSSEGNIGLALLRISEINSITKNKSAIFAADIPLNVSSNP
ncbi:aminomethyltransferase [Rickettsiales bacterium]|nr:aminomethyltransferase [Rickettsiales bacterium]